MVPTVLLVMRFGLHVLCCFYGEETNPVVGFFLHLLVSILVADMQEVFQCSRASNQFHLCSSRLNFLYTPLVVLVLDNKCSMDKLRLLSRLPKVSILVADVQVVFQCSSANSWLHLCSSRCWAKICIHFAEQLVPVMETEGNWHSSGDGSEVFCICWSHQKQALKAKGCGGCLK
ncbi:hypothetical protein ACSBR2_019245 [Camellia fascicularis]